MNKLDYLKKAIALQLFRHTNWMLSVFSVVKLKENTTPYEGMLRPETWGHSFYSEGEWVKIDDAKPNVPLFAAKDRLTIDNSWCSNVKEEVETSVFNLLFNHICILSSFGSKHPYILGRFSIPSIENEIAIKLKDCDPNNLIDRDPAFYYTDEYVKFCDALSYLESFSQLFTWAGTPKNIVSPIGIAKFKKELLLKYGDTLTDPVQLAKFEDELMAFDKEYLKDDPSLGNFTSGKILHTARKKMFLSLGAGISFDNSQKVNPVMKSLEEGWPTEPDLFTATLNDSRMGSLSRGSETVKGGVSGKNLLRAANNFKIDPSDCGSLLGISRTYTTNNIDKLIGRSVIENKVSTLVKNISEANNYLNKKVYVRSPMYCELKGDVRCRACAGEKLAQYPTGLSIPLTEISAIILTASLKLMHTNTTKTAVLNIRENFT